MTTKLIYCKRCTFPTRQVCQDEITHEYKCVCGQVNTDTSINEDNGHQEHDETNDEHKDVNNTI